MFERKFTVDKRKNEVTIESSNKTEDREWWEKRIIPFSELGAILNELKGSHNAWHTRRLLLEAKIKQGAPKPFNLTQADEKLVAQIERISSHKESEKKMREFEGLKKELEILERDIERAAKDIQEVKAIMKEAHLRS